MPKWRLSAGGGVTFELWNFKDQAHPQVEFIKNHVAIFSDSLEEDVQQLIDQGYMMVIPITEGVTLRYAFVRDAAGTTYEIATDKSQPVN